MLNHVIFIPCRAELMYKTEIKKGSSWKVDCIRETVFSKLFKIAYLADFQTIVWHLSSQMLQAYHNIKQCRNSNIKTKSDFKSCFCNILKSSSLIKLLSEMSECVAASVTKVQRVRSSIQTAPIWPQYKHLDFIFRCNFITLLHRIQNFLENFAQVL